MTRATTHRYRLPGLLLPYATVPGEEVLVMQALAHAASLVMPVEACGILWVS